MNRFLKVSILASMMGCATTTPVAPEVTPTPSETPSGEILVAEVPVGPVPYESNDSCASFHDNALVGQPYLMGFHYCLYAEGQESIEGCKYSEDDARSICYNSDMNPVVGVQWKEDHNGLIYVPQHTAPVASVSGELKSIAGGQAMFYDIAFTDGNHSSCVVGGPTVQYCRVGW